jgi:tRNA pseudouridine38-40 synthase
VAGPAFHPRYDAKFRTYRYFFREQDLDVSRMGTAATLFQGVHDFSGFARVDNKNPRRKVLAASIGRDDGIVYLEITAESFLWHMVRCIATALRDVGMGTCEVAGILGRLEGNYSGGIHPAPPEGLVLWEVVYKLGFTPLPHEERRLGKIREWQGYHRVMTRICRIFSETETLRREMP